MRAPAHTHYHIWACSHTLSHEGGATLGNWQKQNLGDERPHCQSISYWSVLNNCMEVHFTQDFINKEPLRKACVAQCDISLSLDAGKRKAAIWGFWNKAQVVGICDGKISSKKINSSWEDKTLMAAILIRLFWEHISTNKIRLKPCPAASSVEQMWKAGMGNKRKSFQKSKGIWNPSWWNVTFHSQWECGAWVFMLTSQSSICDKVKVAKALGISLQSPGNSTDSTHWIPCRGLPTMDRPQNIRNYGPSTSMFKTWFGRKCIHKFTHE